MSWARRRTPSVEAFCSLTYSAEACACVTPSVAIRRVPGPSKRASRCLIRALSSPGTSPGVDQFAIYDVTEAHVLVRSVDTGEVLN